MFRFGLKLWSINGNYIREAEKLYQEKVYDYIELYIVPGSFDKYSRFWLSLGMPFVVHAPHFIDGLNFAKKEFRQRNFKLAAEAMKFADLLKADRIIFHPGIDGDIEETARQIKELAEPRALIENKPYNALGCNLICNGTTPDEIELIMRIADVGFCLDIGHAVCSARAHGRDYISYLQEFIVLKPEMYHLSDGSINNVRDEHRHIGQGNFDLYKILRTLSIGSLITIETDKDSNENLDDFIVDVENIKKMIKISDNEV